LSECSGACSAAKEQCFYAARAMDARGMSEMELVDGARRSTMDELANGGSRQGTGILTEK